MKRLFSIFSLVLITIFGLKGNDSILITFIANCGYLIEIDSHKIVVDGLFKDGLNRYSSPDSMTQNLLTSNTDPFDDVDLILITHSHPDHFDGDMVRDCMISNPNVSLICPKQVQDILSEDKKEYAIISKRIIECTPDTFTSRLIEFSGIDIQVCRLAHSGEMDSNIQNNGYMITINGKSVFHTGDADPFQIDNYTGIRLDEQAIVVGLINDQFGNMNNASITRGFINADYNVTMHLPEWVAKVWLEPLKDKPDLFSNPYVFTSSMEQKVFHIEGIK